MLAIAVDIGGTFTDVIALDNATGRLYVTKTPTTSERLVDGVRTAAVEVLARAGSRPEQVSRFIHGTTVATNAVLERKGAVVALLTTEGFEDVLEIGRLRRTHMYDLLMDAETPVFLAPKRRRKGIKERVDALGQIVVPLDEDQARRTIEDVLKEPVEAFAVCLLFSFRNQYHERRLRELIREFAPNVPISLSSEVDPMFREYERTVVTAFDAYLRPVIEKYVEELRQELLEISIITPLQIMQSRGGITSSQLVEQRPVSVLLSGPAAGVIGGSFAGARSGFSNLITIDVGGTSADISLVPGGKPLLSTEGKVDVYPLRVPMVDVNTIGAGGGSIAWTDSAGGIRVGPASAGANPGPVCYGRGGTQPTVTDASLVLGYLNPEYFAGGAISLDTEAALSAVSQLGENLGLSAIETAAGIHRIMNTKMADEIRLVSVHRGYDPREFALVALGGAGPLHAGRLAADLLTPTVVIPPVPGVLSALGLLVAKVEHDHAETVALAEHEVTPDRLDEVFHRLDAQVTARMDADNIPLRDVAITHSADLRYVGQSYTLEVVVENPPSGEGVPLAIASFHETHRRVYGHSRPSAAVEFVNLRVVHSWALPHEIGIAGTRIGTGTDHLEPTLRRAWFDEFADFVEIQVYHRDYLTSGDVLRGPTIVEQPDTTVVIYPEQVATVDAAGNLILSVLQAVPSEGDGVL